MLSLILLLNSIYISLFWFIVLSFNNKNSDYPKVFLGKFMFIAFLLYICYFIFYYPTRETAQYYFYYIDSFYELFLFLLFPIYYIYIKLITFDKKFSLKKHYKYLILPVFVFLLNLTANFSIPAEEYYKLMYSNNGVQENVTYFSIVHDIVRVLYLLQSITYLILSFIYIKTYSKTIYNFYANIDKDYLYKVYIINISISIIVILYVVFSFVEKKVLIGDSPWLVIPALLASCFLFIIGWLGNHQKSVIVDKTPNKKILEKIENEISVNDEHFNNIRNKIDNLFITEKIYLNAELNLWEVSRLAGTNRTYISIVINHYYNQNFSTFVNNFRVKHVVELIKKNPELTNIDLATLSGFGSVISMQRAIQSFEGKTIREIKTEL